MRYVAVLTRGELTMRQREGVTGASASETDRYEELLVNPTLLTLIRQRGEIDCGGLAHVLIRYGQCHTLVCPLGDGHVNVGFELDVELGTIVDELQRIVTDWAAGSDSARPSNPD